MPRIGGGRVLVVELLKNNSAVKNLIREKKIFQIETVLQTSRGEGMASFDHALAELVRNGQIMIDDALEHAHDPSLIKTMVRN